MIRRAQCLVALLPLLAALPRAAVPQTPESSTPTAAPEAAQAETAEATARGFLGFHFACRASLEALEILDLYPGGPAEKAGLQQGDRVTAVNGVRFRFSSRLELNRAFDWVRPGESVELTVERADQVETLTLVASELPAAIRRQKQETRQLLELIEANETLAHLLAGGSELVFEKLADGSLQVTAEGFEEAANEAVGLLRRQHAGVGQRLAAMRPGDRLRLKISEDPDSGRLTFRWARQRRAGEGD